MLAARRQARDGWGLHRAQFAPHDVSVTRKWAFIDRARGFAIAMSSSSKADRSTRSAPNPSARGALHEELAAELYRALVGRHAVPPLRDRGLDLLIDDAYAISLRILARRERAGERVIGKKIGVTSAPVQTMLGVHQPDFGFLTDRMLIADGGTLVIKDSMIQPRAEAEIALILSQPLKGPGVTPADVLAATAHIAPSFEIVDSRIANWNIGIIDTVADNASCGMFVLGEARVDPHPLDLATLHVKVWKNEQPLSEGLGSAVQGSPLASVAWLANTLGGYGVTLEAGDIILSGSLVPLEPAKPGDHFRLELAKVGTASVHFA
jgi:2-oxopent-4-enoate/cis-2-oxohex-4-enoate hydratase